MATALSKSTLIPKEFQENLPNCLIALEMAQRMGASPMMVMQNLYIVHGKPAWSSQFVIAAINSTGRFSPLRFAMTGEGEKRECIAWAVELGTNERLEGPPVSIDMAKKEGWYGKNGSKWQTMPELMLRYRSATFFGRLYAPEVLMGMREESEVIDVDATPVRKIERAVIEEPASARQSETKAEERKPEKTASRKKAAARADDSERQSEVPPAAAADQKEESKLSIVEQVTAKLKEGGYEPNELVQVAIRHNWTETTTKDLPEISDEVLGEFLNDWSTLVEQMDALRKK